MNTNKAKPEHKELPISDDYPNDFALGMSMLLGLDKQIRTIPLPKGGELEIELTDKFLDVVRKKFDIENVSDITDDHVRMFVYSALDSAIKNSER